MNDPGTTPPPDWDSIFDRARRRILGRVAVVGAIAALGSLFLLGGGLSAQGAVSWHLPGQPSAAKSDTTPGRRKEHPEGKPTKEHREDHPDNGESGNGHSRHHEEGHPERHPHHQWNPCAGKAAAAQEYCEPGEEPTPTSPTGPTDTEGEEESAQSSSTAFSVQ